MKVFTAAERPDLAELADELTRDVLPEYNLHGDVLNRYWGRLTEERPEFQLLLVDEHGALTARSHSLPVRWDGSVDDLPAGIDGAIERGFDEGDANVLCAMVIMVVRSAQQQGVSTEALHAMIELARAHSLPALIAPLRPLWKDRYPYVPIKRYATWRRADGELFDPWMRVHERLGATVLKTEPRSLRITGTVGEWEEWTQMAFPEGGEFWFPGGLAPLTIDRRLDRGSYWEPNVWMLHETAGG